MRALRRGAVADLSGGVGDDERRDFGEREATAAVDSAQHVRRTVGDPDAGGRQQRQDDAGQLRLRLGQRVEDGVPRLDPDAAVGLRVDDGLLEQLRVEDRQHAVPAPVDRREVGERVVDDARRERRRVGARVQPSFHNNAHARDNQQ